QRPHFDYLELDLGYVYGGHNDAVDPITTAVMGGRMPHHWVNLGDRRISTLDLVGVGFVLIAGPEGAEWIDAPKIREMRIPLQVYLVGRDLEPIGGAIPGAEGNGAVLVRPDGHIAW
ncbi:monooxygenase, partial [Mycobacteroides abscessus subsp. massiliense]